MDYLATQPIALPATAEQLRFHYRVFSSCEQDTLADKIATGFTNVEVVFRITDQASGQSYVLTERYADTNGAIDEKQEVTVDVSPLAGASIVIRPELGGPAVVGKQFSYKLGHIYIEQPKALPKPRPQQLKTLEPETFAITQNYPNPFNACTHIQYSLAEAGKVKLAVYDLLGREVAILVNQHQPAGYYEVTFDGRDLASGIYIYRLEAGAYVAIRKLVLVR
ncbi:MAG: T9SS type A sorting domain-containing protein [candidate division KSB1 bacterium]|nr:T9SS type A sorting domain-containing protein [candidate division KSB1 bacterium]